MGKQGVMSTSEAVERAPVFSNETIRWLVGFITFALPILVLLISFARLTSVSAAYYTRARDVFVGSMFVLGAFLIVYKGHTRREDWIANLGGVAAILAALFPTKCDLCTRDAAFYIHAIAGNVLFGVTAYFCLGPFRQAAKEKRWIKAQRRVKFYTICGWSIVACLGFLFAIGAVMSDELKQIWTPTLVGEFVMLWIFGAAWVVASKWFPWFTDKEKEEPLDLLQEFQVRALKKSK